MHPRPSSGLLRAALLPALLCAASAGCRRRASDADAVPEASPAGIVDAALRPAGAATALASAHGAHWKSTTRFSVTAQRAADGAGGEGSPEATRGPQDVTTLTEVWLDDQGQFRLLEENDKDGGREVFWVGRELSVALRYGKLVRRTAQPAEAHRYLQEALGGPWAAWELVRTAAEVSAAAAPTTQSGDALGARVFRVGRASEPRKVATQATPLRRWRESVEVDRLEGEVVVIPAASDGSRPPTLVSARLEAQFHATDHGRPVQGSFRVEATTDGLGTTPAVELPSQAERLRLGQRTSLDERFLLGDEPLPGAASPGGEGGP